MAMASPVPRPSCTCGCADQPSLNKGPWTPEEDAILADYISQHGDHGNWRKLPKAAGLMRCGKSCRLRWRNYLRPDLKRGEFGEDEDNLIIQLHALLGNKWSLIAGRIPGRTDNEIKNYWNWHLAKKLMEKGIDPKTHEPLRSMPPESTKKRSRKPKNCREDSDSKPKNYTNNVKRVKADYRSYSFNSPGSTDSSVMSMSLNRSSSFSSIEQLIYLDEETEKSGVSETISDTISDTIAERPTCQLPSPDPTGSSSSDLEGGSTSSSSIMAPSSPSSEFLRTVSDFDGITEQIYTDFSSELQDCWINSPSGADNMFTDDDNNKNYQNHQPNNQSSVDLGNLDFLEDLDCGQFWEQCLHSISEQSNLPNWQSNQFSMDLLAARMM